jgi:hypothetical protein
MDVLGREPGDGARPRTNWRYWQGAAYDYGSEGWEFEPLRARRSEVVHALGPSLWVSMGLEFSSDRR